MPSIGDAVRFRRTVDRLVRAASANARSHAEDLLRAFDPDMPEGDWRLLREAVVRAFLGDVNLGSDAVASVAAAFYNKCLEGVEGAGTAAADGSSRISPAQAEGTVRRLAGALFRTAADGRRLPPDRKAFLEGVESYASKRTRESANETVERCVERSPNKEIRYQRVPTGAETCTYCAMLASRGAVYRNKAKAGKASHNNCRCMAVPTVRGAVVEGVDQEAWVRTWERFVEIDSMDGLTQEERRALKSVSLTLANPDGAGVADIDVLSEIDTVMKDPMTAFKAERPRSAGTYERTVKKRLEEIGRGCGVSLSGSVGASSKGSVVGATPSPDEVGLALIYGLHGARGTIVFNPEINSSVPDARTPEGYLEIKDVASVRKIYKRLADARRKMTSVGAKRRSVVLGVSNMAASRKEVLERVRPFLADGTFDDVLVVWNRCGSERSLLEATAK
ncbi:hypothetical protein AAK967_00635 [Atopobiaceae bacterium 24-176]